MGSELWRLILRCVIVFTSWERASSSDSCRFDFSGADAKLTAKPRDSARLTKGQKLKSFNFRAAVSVKSNRKEGQQYDESFPLLMVIDPSIHIQVQPIRISARGESLEPSSTQDFFPGWLDSNPRLFGVDFRIPRKGNATVVIQVGNQLTYNQTIPFQARGSPVKEPTIVLGNPTTKDNYFVGSIARPRLWINDESVNEDSIASGQADSSPSLLLDDPPSYKWSGEGGVGCMAGSQVLVDNTPRSSSSVFRSVSAGSEEAIPESDKGNEDLPACGATCLVSIAASIVIVFAIAVIIYAVFGPRGLKSDADDADANVNDDVDVINRNVNNLLGNRWRRRRRRRRRNDDDDDKDEKRNRNENRVDDGRGEYRRVDASVDEDADDDDDDDDDDSKEPSSSSAIFSFADLEKGQVAKERSSDRKWGQDTKEGYMAMMY